MINKTISPNLKEAGFIVLRKDSKKPLVEKGVDWNTQIINYDQANAKLQEGYNIGLVGGYNRFVVVDCDKPETFEAFNGFMQPTYTESSISGNKHLIYRYKNETNETDNTDFDRGKEHLGEFRAYRRYVAIAPSRAKDEKKGINDVRDYKIIEDNPICEINKGDIEKIKAKLTLNSSISTENEPKDESRSGREFAEVCRLIRKGLNKESLFSSMSAFSKWSEAPDSYKELTYTKALKAVQESKKWESDEFGLKTNTPNVYKPITLMSLSDISKAKVDKSYIVEGMLYPESVNMIYSPPAQFKSLITLLLALNVARGEQFLRMKTKKSSILICDKENNLKILQERINALKEGHKISKLPRNVHILKQGDLLEPSFVKQLFEVVKEKKIKIVVFDTLHRFADYDENSANDINHIYNNVFEVLRNDYKCSVIFLHHTKKDGGYRGSSDFLGMVDTAYSVTREAKTGRFKLECQKARSGEIETIIGDIDFAEDGTAILIKRLNEVQEEINAIDKQKYLTKKIKEFAPENKKFKRKDIEYALNEASIAFSTSTLKRALNYLKDVERFFEFDEVKNEYWRCT